jgi:hypothetical protein
MFKKIEKRVELRGMCKRASGRLRDHGSWPGSKGIYGVGMLGGGEGGLGGGSGWDVVGGSGLVLRWLAGRLGIRRCCST